jgi:hypothetical protein
VGVCGGLPTEPLGSLVAPQSHDRRYGVTNNIWVHQEASKRATCDMIEVLALGGRKGPLDVRPFDGELHVLIKMPLRRLVL